MSNRPKIYLDAAPLIDLAKVRVGMRPSLDDQRQNNVWYLNRFLEAAMDGQVELFTSILTVAECTNVGEPEKLEDAKRVYMGLLGSGKAGIRLVQPTLAIAEKARELYWSTPVHLKGADGLHVASALRMGCREFFTCDGKILRSAGTLDTMGLTVCQPSDSLLLPHDYQQTELELDD